MGEYRGLYLGKDKYGFSYYLRDDNYIYQWYPDEDFWKCGINMKGKANGWYCSAPAWDRTMHKCIVE